MERNLVYDGINLLFSIWYIKFKIVFYLLFVFLVMIY